MMNSVQLIGRLTSDPEIRYTPNGKPVANFTLAVKKNYTPEQGEDTDFIRCVAVNKIADTIGNYVKKGHIIAIEGNISTRSYEKDGQRIYVTEVFVEQFHFLEKKQEASPPPGNPYDRNR